MNHIRFIRLKNFPDRLQADTVLMRSPPWRQPSIQGRARHSNGKRPQRHLTNFSDRPTSSLRGSHRMATRMATITERLYRARNRPALHSSLAQYTDEQTQKHLVQSQIPQRLWSSNLVGI